MAMRVGSTTRGNTTSTSTSNRGDVLVTRSKADKAYICFTGSLVPLGPVFQRDTLRREVERGSIWVFEQTQALEDLSVYTPVRMTVIKLRSGGLWIHAPVAPTAECVRLVQELGCPVEYIVLPTFAYEHKIFVGPFSRAFPDAEVYVTPYQWSFPVNLPNEFLGINPTGELTPTEEGMPWADEIGQRLLLPPSISIGDYARQPECAFFHKKSKTLLVTDSVIMLNDNVPDIIPVPALLESARDSWLNRFRAGGRSSEEVKAISRPELRDDTLENRIRGYRRMSLICLYFIPSDLLCPDNAWRAISDRLICPPVVETLVYSNFKPVVRAWVDSITSDWAFNKVIPAHFDAPVRATPSDFRRAFAFAYEGEGPDQERRSGSGGGAAGTSGRGNGDDSSAPGAAAPGSRSPGFLAGLFGGLPGAWLGGGGGGRGGEERPRRVVEFPDADIEALRGLIWLLRASGIVRPVNE
ncbi:hypothetical protein FOA52_003435 [Chlamydomonas sp. UWO 241]|nr:hypothetical protein FOA52_003435 [Chlamydomonas sp. UWO 241]